MPDLKLGPDELKKLIKKAKSGPMPFAFCPGGDDQDDLLLIHRRKDPQRLGKSARKQVGGTKVSFGTFEVVGKDMKITAVKLIPALAKKLKKLLREQKISMNVLVVDADGNIV